MASPPPPATDGPNLVTLLTTAQSLASKKDFKGAYETFTKLLEAFPQLRKTSPLPMLTRALCAFELKMWNEALEDALAVAELPDQKTPNEIIGGCFTTRSAALTVAARTLADPTNPSRDPDRAQLYAKSAHQSNMNMATSAMTSHDARIAGNDLFKAGKLDEALEKYRESTRVDDGNAESWGNISVVLGRQGKWKEAEEAARTATEKKPTWPKGWYRLGNALMSQNRYTDAVAAFHAGIQNTPKGEEVDADLKKKYSEAVRLAEKEKVPAAQGQGQGGGNEDAMPKRVMGMLQQIRMRSWNVKQYCAAFSAEIAFPSLTTVFSRTAPTTPASPAPFVLISDPPVALQQTLARAMRAKFPEFVLDTPPITYWHTEMEKQNGRPVPDKSHSYDPKAPESHLLLHHPLITAAWLFHLCSLSGSGVPSGPRPSDAASPSGKAKKSRAPATKPDWQLVFTLNFRAPPPMARMLTPVYAAVVDRSSRTVVDFMSWIVGLPEGTLFRHAVMSPPDPNVPQAQETVWHTSESLGEMLELIEEIYDFDRKMVERQAALGVQNGHSHHHSGHDGHSHDHSHDHSHGGHGDHSHDHSHGGEALPEDEYEYPADEPILEESFAERNFGKLYSYYTAHPYIVIAALGLVLTILLSALLDWASQRPSRSTPITEEL